MCYKGDEKIGLIQIVILKNGISVYPSLFSFLSFSVVLNGNCQLIAKSFNF